MDSAQLRNAFYDFFRQKEHSIIASAPMVIKNDPTLMFTNAGMNQFKDIFLGNQEAVAKRVANSQKCLRVSGKHNDLEEVGRDTYHHTMFEMLGNWSFGDYFKEEAIEWSYEFLVEKMGIDKDRLYATIFEGSSAEGLETDSESASFWKKHLPADRVLKGSKKDNFWEMGETGPCGPCSEVHIDLRPDDERKAIPGSELVNKNHPRLIEIWNLVFIQYNRMADGRLEDLPHKHVDTGMGIERLCMVVQGKDSNYDTDIFQSIISKISEITGLEYKAGDSMQDIAIRVVADHLRAVSFSIAEGQLPSNNKAGYVIRRILRRAVRYSYSFLDRKEAFIYKLVPVLSQKLGEAFPELLSQQDLISRVIEEEESSFLKTLEKGIILLEEMVSKALQTNSKEISGEAAFELYDTYGFPLDLTELILEEHAIKVNNKEFEECMLQQRSRSRKAGRLETGDWMVLSNDKELGFIGYENTESQVDILKYRKITKQGEDYYQLVFNATPFYAESGGQAGDTGIISDGNMEIEIIDTQKENELIVHYVKELPENPGDSFTAIPDKEKRKNTARHHSATHLLHKALKDTLGDHVEQKGSLVNSEGLRFDFSHFRKLTNSELVEAEQKVNTQIRANHRRITEILSYNEALRKGAIALFGEKYGDKVRLIGFGESLELCGGTHVDATGEIGIFKIRSEASVAAGIRRIEAVCGSKAEEYILQLEAKLANISSMLKNPADIERSIQILVEENQKLKKDSESLKRSHTKDLTDELINKHMLKQGEFSVIIKQVEAGSPAELKDLAFKLRQQVKMLYAVLGAEIDGKAHLLVALSDELVEKYKLNAGEIIRKIASEIKGGGGGQAFLATAGGKEPSGIKNALNIAAGFIK